MPEIHEEDPRHKVFSFSTTKNKGAANGSRDKKSPKVLILGHSLVLDTV